MLEFEDYIKKMCKTERIFESDLKRVKYLHSFHEIIRILYQRTDTKQYILIEWESAYRDGDKDYFMWKYITEDEKNKLLNEMRPQDRTDLSKEERYELSKQKYDNFQKDKNINYKTNVQNNKDTMVECYRFALHYKLIEKQELENEIKEKKEKLNELIEEIRLLEPLAKPI